MLQSNFWNRDRTNQRPRGIHVGIIMDGNGRWARGRGRPRPFGHREGVAAVRRVVQAAPDQGIAVLTLYAFSSDNWQRPGVEVRALMRLFRTHLASETARCVESGVRLGVIGRRDRLVEPLRLAIEAAEAATAECDALHLRIAMDYSARDTIVRAASRASATCGDEAFAELLGAVNHAPAPSPDVDLLIRTGGEQRLSDFLLWECAYAELFFTPTLWPDFGPRDLEAAIREFHTRERRFGAVPRAAAV